MKAGLFPKSGPLTVTTDAAGNATAYIPASGTHEGGCYGPVLNILYVKPGSGAYSNGVTITVSCEKSGLVLWQETLATNASKTVAPSQPVHNQAGATVGAQDFIHLAGERVKIVISGGGNTLAGQFSVQIGEPAL